VFVTCTYKCKWDYLLLGKVCDEVFLCVIVVSHLHNSHIQGKK
jgi:hypothetical protein